MPNELISRDALIKKLTPKTHEPAFQHEGEDYFVGVCDIICDVLEAPTVDVAPVVHGRWKFGRNVCGTDLYQCSECGRIHAVMQGTDAYSDAPYCHCGARMDGKEK